MFVNEYELNRQWTSKDVWTNWWSKLTSQSKSNSYIVMHVVASYSSERNNWTYQSLQQKFYMIYAHADYWSFWSDGSNEPF